MTEKKKRPCFICNGTGEMCGSCGEASNCDPCEDDGHPSLENCKDCKGTGIASADLEDGK